MKRYSTILIDDEPLALQRLEKLLKPYGDTIDILAKASNGFDAIKAIDELQPDIIFLDIQMPELNGFDVLERIKHQPFVIFSTAYDEYALRAFETNSIDYLLKPVTSSRLDKAIEKLKTLTGEKMESFQSQLSDLLLNIKSSPNRIQVRKGDKIKLIHPENIYFFSADEKYTRLNTYDESYLIDKSLSVLETELDDPFVRVHRKAIINMNFIDEISKMFKGSYKVIMKDENKTELPVSRALKHRLGI